MRLTQQTRLRVEALEDRSVPSAAFVLDWNELLTNVQQARGQGNQQAARALAMMNAAVYDSVNAVNPTHTVYHVDAQGFPDVSIASADAAAAQAAHDVAVRLYTNPAEVARFDGLLATELGEVPDGPAEDAGVALGAYVADQIVTWRANDGATASVPYVQRFEPGQWRPTPPAFAQTPNTPQWRYVTPFAMTSGDQFRPGPPPALTSAEYTAAFQEVKELGRIDSTTRTPEQTQIAFFWAGAGVSNAGVGIWNQIARTVAAERDLSLADNARLFAQMSVANADAFIAGFDTKYEYNFWRPVTAIRAADTDGNPDTAPDPTWTPLIATPNHQSYVSLHSTQSMAAAQSLAAFFGTDQVPFTATWAGVDRSFNKFTEAAKEAGASRIYAGIHWSFDKAVGLQQGRKIGQYVADNFFQPLGESLTAAGAPARPVHQSLRANRVQPLLAEALARWQAAGVDTSALAGIDVRVADLGGTTLGLASGRTIWLDDNAAGWGWFVDRTPRGDSEFSRPGNQGERHRMDLLTVLEHEVGHLLGYGHEPTGLMQETLAAGTRVTVGPAAAKPGDSATLIAWSPDSPVFEGLVSGTAKKV
jgi:PAP2 superfamily